MALVYLKHTLVRLDHSKGFVTTDPGQVIDVSDQNKDEILRLEAGVEPTDEQIALYRLANPEPAQTTTKKGSSKAETSGSSKAETSGSDGADPFAGAN